MQGEGGLLRILSFGLCIFVFSFAAGCSVWEKRAIILLFVWNLGWSVCLSCFYVYLFQLSCLFPVSCVTFLFLIFSRLAQMLGGRERMGALAYYYGGLFSVLFIV